MYLKMMISMISLSVFLLAGGCSTREIATGAAVGAGAYEYSNKRAMDDLKDDYESGKITREEYEERKDDIEDRSVVY